MNGNRNMIIGILVCVCALALAFWAGREYEQDESVPENLEETVDRAGDEIEDGLDEAGDKIEDALDKD